MTDKSNHSDIRIFDYPNYPLQQVLLPLTHIRMVCDRLLIDQYDVTELFPQPARRTAWRQWAGRVNERDVKE
ncbi:hypothetical protein M514_12754 [Trichuris suis]|uniref:Uncharacterized protein n=1 Tax=Trichuris suis TaxID=68888 RepID=A0A085LN37_9BILA|nr:hypothetical protein M513_12754 [Trichuris suis]KFD65028.1 hypothetical protein M514_12754 [Trichuris suis]